MNKIKELYAHIEKLENSIIVAKVYQDKERIVKYLKEVAEIQKQIILRKFIKTLKIKNE